MKFLSGIKRKILIGFFLAIVTLLATGLVAFYSLENMLSAVDEFAVPDKSVSLMYDISTDLGLISNYNRIYSITNDRAYQEKIEQTSETTLSKIDSLESLLAHDSVKVKQIDSLKLLLSGIAGESKKIANAKNSIDVNRITSRLAQQILEQVRSDSTLINDSSVVIKSTTSEIRESSFYMNDEDSSIKKSEEQKDINFFQKLGFLFSKKRPTGLIDTLYLLPDKRVDTLTTVSKDSAIYLTKNAFIEKLDSIMRSVQTEEIQNQNRIHQMELAFSHHNNEMIEKARSILTSINQSTIQTTFEEINSISSISKLSKKIILFMIILFAVAGVVLIIFVLADISKSNYYQEELINAKKISDQSAKAKLDFLAKMSHEIRTPLTSILGFSGMLKNQKSEYVKIIKNSSEQLLNTANEILDLAKVDAGIIEINRKPFHLNRFLNFLMLDYEMKSASRNFEFEFEIVNGEETLVLSDEFRLRQILTNILNNAFKFTEKGKVSFSCHHQKNTDDTLDVMIKIQDSGIGINKDDLQKIFLEYQQVGSTVLKKQGFGLGLSIVKKLVHLLNGEMKIDSNPGEGTTFSLNFTFETVTKETLIEETGQPDTEILSGYSFLIIDDDKTILKLFSTIIKKYGGQTITVENPEEMWLELKNKHIDLCLMDIQLSGSNGVELCKEIKSEKEFESLKIIASTANLIGISTDDLLDAGFDHILYKPIREVELIKEICDVLDLHIEEFENAKNDDSSVKDELNLKGLHQFTMGDDSLLKEILEQFIIDTEKDIDLLNQSLKDQNRSRIMDVLHRFSSRLSQFGADSLAAKSKTIEQQLHNNNDLQEGEIQQLIQSSQKFITQTKRTLKSHHPA